MPDKMRWRYGDTNPVVAAVAAETVIEIGDLLWQEAACDGADDARPASAMGDRGSETQNQAAFARSFLGVAMQRSRQGDTAPIRVATTGVFEFDCPPAVFKLGELIGAARLSDARMLENQAVMRVHDPRMAIGRVAGRRPTPQSSVLVDILSTVMTGGVAGTTATAQSTPDL